MLTLIMPDIHPMDVAKMVILAIIVLYAFCLIHVIIYCLWCIWRHKPVASVLAEMEGRTEEHPPVPQQFSPEPTTAYLRIQDEAWIQEITRVL